MNETPDAAPSARGEMPTSAAALLRFMVIAVTAFLTLVDLFATQVILPELTHHYGVSPAAMGTAVNASTLGMAVSGLAVAYFGNAIDRRLGILLKPGGAFDPHCALGPCAGSTDLHRLARSAGLVHGVGLHAYPGLSRRAL